MDHHCHREVRNAEAISCEANRRRLVSLGIVSALCALQ